MYLLTYLFTGRNTNLLVKTMECCSCGQYEASCVRLAALRQSAASCSHGGSGEWSLHNGPLTSAFTIYCNCTKQRSVPVTSTDVGYFIPSAAAADLIFTRWHYWSLMFYRPYFQHLESSAWMNFRYLHHRHQQQNQIVIRKRPQSMRGKPAGVSTTSARHYLCRSCSYSTDRKNNLKRHVIRMHRQRTNFQWTSRFPVK